MCPKTCADHTTTIGLLFRCPLPIGGTRPKRVRGSASRFSRLPTCSICRLAGGSQIRTLGPSCKGSAISASHHAEFVDDHPSSFQIAEPSILPRESREQQRRRFSPHPSPWLRRRQLRNIPAQFRIYAGI